MALKRAADGHYLFECTASDIDPGSILDYEDTLDDQFCPVCEWPLDILGRCAWRNEPNHKQPPTRELGRGGEGR